MAKVTLSDLSKVFKDDKKPSDFHYYGQIVSVDAENRTYEVSINRDESITVEAARLVGAGVGDTVMVTVMANGYATVTGRVGGDMDASDAQRTADNASDAASSALSQARSAVGTASQAQNKAVEALGIANNAVELAEQAEEEAGRASTAAEQAAASASSAEADAARAATSAANAEADASSASTSAQNAAASASSAATSAQNAASDASSAATSASNAASDAASAATSAQNAASDASSAATSASNAASSASSASTSASNAATSAQNAASDAATASQQSSAATTAANQAKAQAQAAETAATEAKADASTAKTQAAAANAAANGAVAGLAVVQGVVDQLETDVDDMQTHVAMMNAIDEGDVHIPAGLHVVPSASGYFMVIANDGVYVYDNESVLVAKYGHNIVYDSNREHKIGNNTSYIRYYDSNNDGVADAIEIVADNIRLGSYSVGDKITATETTLNNYMSSNNTRVGNVETSVNTTTTNLTNYITSNNQAIENLQGQIDGSIQTWFYEVVPTNDNPPAVNWTTTDLKNNHLGDLYYDTITGYCYRYQVQNNVYGWQRITDVDVTKALADAAKAQDTADHKRRVFVTTPAPPYEIGDLWVQGQNGDIFRCATPKTSQQSYDAADWVKASKYTDDTKANSVETDLHTNYYVKSDFSVEPDKIASTISATETTVKTYADGKASAAESNAKTYADGKASTAESNAKTYADNNFDPVGSAASALDDAKDYADDNFDTKGSASAAQSAAISAAATDATTKANNAKDAAISAAATDATTKANSAKNAAITAAAADATSKANAAEANAKADTTEKLKSYYTKTQTDSAITQSADNILSTVSTTYQTKDDMDDYSTTSEMNSAINQKADSITSTVAQTYATKTQAQGYADTAESNAKTAAATDATNKANAAKQEAIADAATKYYTKTQTYTKSEIEQKAGEISLSVAQEETAKVISVKEASGSIVHIDDAIEYPALSLTATIAPKQSGTGTPSPDNVRPISGWTGAEVQRTGKNLIDSSVIVQGNWNNEGSVYQTNVVTHGYLPIKGGQTYMWSASASVAGRYIRFYDENKNFDSSGSISQYDATNRTFTAPSWAHYMRILWYQGNGITADYIKSLNPQIELGSTATAYEPYTATTTTTSLGRTVYGGTVDVVSGELVVEQLPLAFDSSAWGFSSNFFYKGNILDAGTFVTGYYTTENGVKMYLNANNGQARIYLTDNAFLTSESDVGALLNGYKLLYELAEPQTYTLTPKTINTLQGVNNVWADSGDVYLKYATMNPDMQALMNKSNDDLSRAKAEIKVTTDAIESTVSTKVGNDEIISKIRQSAETVKIQANRVEIDGTATFNAIKSQTDAAYDAKNSAATAESNAKTYADGKASTAETNAKTYADGKASTAESNAKTYADGKASTAETNAKTYADGKASTAETNAKTYADGKASTAETNAKTYADGKASTAETNAKTYADGKASTKADKTAALSRSQRIYYRSTSIQNSLSGPTTWLSTSGTGYENWSLSIPQLTNGEDAYPYLYTCVQNQTAAQYAAGSVCTCTPVVRDDSTTVIDGGSITTGQILARYIETNGLYINSTQVNDLDDLLDTKQNAGDYITDSDFDERISDIATAVNTLNGQILFGDDGTNTFILLQNHVKDNPESVTGVQAKLTSGKLAFGTFGSVDNEVAYFSSEELKVQKRLSFGNFVMKQRDNGHLSIMFEGGDD